MILVTGAGGKTGKAVINALISRGVSVRGIVNSEKNREKVKALGAETIMGDMRRLENMLRAVDGVESIYHISPNVHEDELEFGKTAVAAAVSAGVRRFVFHSLCHPQVESLPNHWLKLRVEDKIKESGLNFTILQPTPYMQNVLGQWKNIMERGIYEIPYQPSTLLGMVDLADIAEVAARVLTTEKNYDWATYELAGPEILSQVQVLDTLRRVTGKEINLEVISREKWCERAARNGMPPYAVSVFYRMFEFMENSGFWGNPGVLEWLLQRKAHRFEEWFTLTYHNGLTI